MFKKNIGWILFVGGLLIQEFSHMVDTRLLHVLGGVLWPIGMVMSINAMIPRDQENRSNEQEQRSKEQENT